MAGSGSGAFVHRDRALFALERCCGVLLEKGLQKNKTFNGEHTPWE
jgi:hypothetical protein